MGKRSRCYRIDDGGDGETVGLVVQTPASGGISWLTRGAKSCSKIQPVSPGRRGRGDGLVVAGEAPGTVAGVDCPEFPFKPAGGAGGVAAIGVEQILRFNQLLCPAPSSLLRICTVLPWETVPVTCGGVG